MPGYINPADEVRLFGWCDNEDSMMLIRPMTEEDLIHIFDNIEEEQADAMLLAVECEANY